MVIKSTAESTQGADTQTRKRIRKTGPESLLQNEHGGAALLGCPPTALRLSRVTGLLWGVPAPKFVKIGRSVRYRTDTLREWVAQFAEQSNTLGG